MTWTAFTLLRPGWLLALVPAGILLWRLARAPAGEGGIWRQAVDSHLLPHLLVAGNPRSRRLGLAALALGLGLAILALAGPALKQGSTEAYRRDATRVLVADLSPAMADPARLEKARLKLLGLLRALPEGQTALVAYGGEPYLVAPPTTDGETIARFVPELAPDALPVAGNQPGRALSMAARVLERNGAGSRDVVWVTAGRGEGPLPDLSGLRLFILHAAAVADPALAAVARGSGGVYVPLADDEGDIRQLAAVLAPTGGWRVDAQAGRAEGMDLGYWLLLPLLPLAALVFRRSLLGLLLAPLFLGALMGPAPVEAADLWQDYQAWRRFQAGDGLGSAAGFRDARWQAAARYRAGQFDQAAALLEGAGDPDSLYNRGNALARSGRLKEALETYEAALQLRPEDGDTVHNRDLVKRLLNPPRGSGQPPPPPPTSPPPREAEREASRLAEQWLGKVPDEPGTLLRRKLASEHRRRQAGEGGPAW